MLKFGVTLRVMCMGDGSWFTVYGLGVMHHHSWSLRARDDGVLNVA